jgi:heat shock protein HslJ
MAKSVQRFGPNVATTMIKNHAVQLALCSMAFLACLVTDAKSAPRKATGGSWVFQEGFEIPAVRLRDPTLQVRGSNLSGSTGCNNFTAVVKRLGSKRVEIQQVALTRMLCEPAQNNIEKAFVRNLKQTAFVQYKGKLLSFVSSERVPLLVWKKPSSGSSGRKSSLRRHDRRVAHNKACFTR